MNAKVSLANSRKQTAQKHVRDLILSRYVLVAVVEVPHSDKKENSKKVIKSFAINCLKLD